MAIGKILTVVRQLFGADVQVSAPSNGEVLQYNGTTKRWANAAAAGGSSLTGNPDVTITGGTDGNITATTQGAGRIRLFSGDSASPSTGARINLDGDDERIDLYTGTTAVAGTSPKITLNSTGLTVNTGTIDQTSTGDTNISATGSGGEVNISSAQSNLKLSAGSDNARIQIDPINVYIGSAANVEGDNTGTTTLNCGQTGSLKFQVFGTTILETTTDYGLRMPELGVDPAAPAANYGVFFMRDNGAGKTQFCVRFSSGAVQVIATQP